MACGGTNVRGRQRELKALADVEVEEVACLDHGVDVR